VAISIVSLSAFVYLIYKLLDMNRTLKKQAVLDNAIKTAFDGDAQDLTTVLSKYDSINFVILHFLTKSLIDKLNSYDLENQIIILKRVHMNLKESPALKTRLAEIIIAKEREMSRRQRLG